MLKPKKMWGQHRINYTYLGLNTKRQKNFLIKKKNTCIKKYVLKNLCKKKN